MKKSRGKIWLFVLLVVVVAAAGWYCIFAIQKNKVPEDATLVQGEAWEDEGEV